MDEGIENFCTRLAAGAGSTYVWCLDDGCLTAKVPPPQPLPADVTDAGVDSVRLCPLSAQATLEQGRVFYSWDYGDAWRALELTFDVGWSVMTASDGAYGPADSVLGALRARLLRICGLAEEGKSDAPA